MTITSIRFSIESSIRRDSILGSFCALQSRPGLTWECSGLLFLDGGQEQLGLEIGSAADDARCAGLDSAADLNPLISLQTRRDVAPLECRGSGANEVEFCSFVADDRLGRNR